MTGETPVLKSKAKIDFKEYKTKKSLTYYSDYLNTSDDKTHVIYYSLPVNSIYWTIGFYNDEGAFETINMSKYKTIEKGDILAILIGNNKHGFSAVKEDLFKRHKSKFPYKKIYYDFIKVDKPFYIRFNLYSNKYHKHDIYLSLREYVYGKLKYEEYKKPITNNIEYTYNITYDNIEKYNSACNKIFDETKFTPINVNLNTNELNSELECVTNKSDVIELKENQQFVVVAFDHFKGKFALHANIKFYNADNDVIFRTEITSEISNSFNANGQISMRRVSFKLPEDIKRFYVVEYIYSDYVNLLRVNPENMCPIKVYLYENNI